MPQQKHQVDEIMVEVRSILALSSDVTDRSRCSLWWANGALDYLTGRFDAPDPLLDHAYLQAYLDGIHVTREARRRDDRASVAAIGQ